MKRKRISLGKNNVLTATQIDEYMTRQTERWNAIRFALRSGAVVWNRRLQRFVPRS